MKELLEAAAKPLWKEIRDLALKKGTETFVAEGIKSVIEVVKRRQLRRDDHEFDEWKKSRAKAEKEEAGSKKTDAEESNEPVSEEAPAEPSPQPPEDP